MGFIEPMVFLHNKVNRFSPYELSTFAVWENLVSSRVAMRTFYPFFETLFHHGPVTSKFSELSSHRGGWSTFTTSNKCSLVFCVQTDEADWNANWNRTLSTCLAIDFWGQFEIDFRASPHYFENAAPDKNLQYSILIAWQYTLTIVFGISKSPVFHRHKSKPR